MEYAVVESFGKQYLIKPGDTFVVNGTVDEKDLTKSYTILLHKDSKLEIGSPSIKTTLPLVVVEHKKSDKIKVFTYKAKSRYRKHKGHRQAQTVIQWQLKTVNSSKSTEVKSEIVEKKSTPVKKPATAAKVTKATTKKETKAPRKASTK